jgi:tRNA A-37 threonylcarbamoyl transferase component Bud32
VDRFPDFICQERAGLTIWIDRQLIADELLRLLKNPDVLFGRPGTRVIKDQRKIKVARVPLKVAGQVRGVYLKRFNVFSWRYRLSSLFISSGALRALRGAHVLSAANIPAARAMAAVEFRSSRMVTKSFFLTEEIVGGKTADAYWREELETLRDHDAKCRRQNFLRRLALLFRHLHDQNVYHNDLKDVNILVVPGSDRQPESIFLLDLEGIRRYWKLSRRRKIKNLVQLNRSLGSHLPRSDKLVFIKSYLSRSFADRREMKRWIRAVLEQSREEDREKSERKHSGADGDCENG